MEKNYVEVDGTVLVNLRDDTLSSASQIAEGVTAHLRTGAKVTGTGSNINPLSGKIAVFDGDSICYGAGSTGGYPAIIATETGMTVQNLGVSGGTITPVTGTPHCIATSILNGNTAADYVILEGGGNDADQNVTLGQITSGFDSVLDPDTFAGAFELMIRNAYSRYPTAKIGYIFIHKCIANFDSRTSNSYYNVAKAACEKWGVPYCDLNTHTPPIAYLADLRVPYTYDSDGIHPNQAGYELFYVPKITAWLKTL